MNTRVTMCAVAWVGLLAVPLAHAAGAGVRSPTCLQQSNTLLKSLVDADYVHARAGFNTQMQALVSAAAMQRMWTQVQSAFGVYQRLGTATQVASPTGSVVFTPVTFAKTPKVFEVSCSAQGKIDGLHVLSPAQAGAVAGELKAATTARHARRAAPSPAAAAMATLMSEETARQRAPHPPVKPHVEADGVRVEPLTVPSAVGALRGALTLPAGKGPFPAVVLVAGSGPNDMDETIGPNKPFRNLADGLAKAGIASLRYDKRTFDHPAKTAAEPDFTVDDEITDDALTALHLLAKQPSIDPRRVFVLGHSEGAMLAPRIAKRDPRLAGVVMLAAPARPFLDVLAGQVRAQGRKSGASKAQIAALEQGIAKERALLATADPRHPPRGMSHVIPDAPVPQSYLLSLYDYHQVAVAKTLPVPLLILQGGSDFQVSPTLDFAAWKTALAGKPGVTFRLYPGLSHLFRPAGKTGTVADYIKPGAMDPKVIADVAAWIKAQPAR